MWCDGCTNLTFTGGGVIDGAGLTRDEPPPGDGCRLVALRSCADVLVQGVTLESNGGGWFMILANNATNLTVGPSWS